MDIFSMENSVNDENSIVLFERSRIPLTMYNIKSLSEEKKIGWLN